MLAISEVDLTVSDAVALINQTLETVYPTITVVGELSSFRVSKNKWVYFDLKDEYAKLHCFGTIYMMPGPLQDGMLVKVTAQPRLHPLYGFTATIQSIAPVGEGSLKKAAALLEAKLTAEGLFAPERKRLLPEIPERIALIASDESAGYSDFIKIIKKRWPAIEINVFSVLVQGMDAPEQIVDAVSRANQEDYQVIVVTRGGGSADDLAAFSDERVVRAVAASRIPTLVAIGHERDISLAELAADVRASTPSNAAEILVPDVSDFMQSLDASGRLLRNKIINAVQQKQDRLQNDAKLLSSALLGVLSAAKSEYEVAYKYLRALSPYAVLKRGYAVARQGGKIIKNTKSAKQIKQFDLEFYDGSVKVRVE